MGTPESVTIIRHGYSAYNELRPIKDNSFLYQEFVKAFDENPSSDRSRELAMQVQEQIKFNFSDRETPLAECAKTQSKTMAKTLSEMTNLPDIIFISPYKRAHSTLEDMISGWPDLAKVETIMEERLIEKNHGIYDNYNDWRIFYVFHPEQREAHHLKGAYWYKYPQGENTPDVRRRVQLWSNTLNNEFSGKKVFAITHYYPILSFRANIERLGEEGFRQLSRTERPINSGVTIYNNDSNQTGNNTRLNLNVYNLKLF